MVPFGSSPDKVLGPNAAFACHSDRAIAAVGASFRCCEVSIGVQSGPLIGAQKGSLCAAGSRPEAAELSSGADGSGRRVPWLRLGS
jgi:hypothetical protein